MKFRFESASANVREIQENVGFVTWVQSNLLGRGHASGLMREIVTWADEKQIYLYLEARGFRTVNGRPRMSNQELAEFYKKFGFHRTNRIGGSREIWMERYPIAKNS